MSETLSQTHGDALTEASQPAVDGGDAVTRRFRFLWIRQPRKPDGLRLFKEGAASQQSEWAHVVPGQLDDADATAGA